MPTSPVLYPFDRVPIFYSFLSTDVLTTGSLPTYPYAQHQPPTTSQPYVLTIHGNSALGLTSNPPHFFITRNLPANFGIVSSLKAPTRCPYLFEGESLCSYRTEYVFCSLRLRRLGSVMNLSKGKETRQWGRWSSDLGTSVIGTKGMKSEQVNP